jgi:hypothetical protein
MGDDEQILNTLSALESIIDFGKKLLIVVYDFSVFFMADIISLYIHKFLIYKD